MPSEIDRVGAFRGKPVETGVGATKNGFPQFVGRIMATERYVEDAMELAVLGLEGGPQWVDWSGYEAYLTGYFCLFGSVDKENPSAGMKKLDFQFEGLNKALGWDGKSLAELGTADYSDKTLTFWVEDHEWNGVNSLRISGLDAADADPVRSIRALDPAKLKDLDAKFAAMMGGGKAAPAAKAASAPGKATPGKATPAKPSAPAAAKPSSAPASGAPTATPKLPTKPAAPKPKAPVEEAPFDAAEITDQATAWDAVYKNKGKADDNATAEAFITACSAVAPGMAEDAITPEQYVEIAKKAIAALNK